VVDELVVIVPSGSTMIVQPEPSDDFYARALDRIQKIMFVLGIATLITAWISFGWKIGVGFALGAAIAYLNFHWLTKIVAGISELTSGSGAATSRRVVHRFVLRYVLMAVIAFVILAVSRESLYGLFAGLFLPAAAILCEAVYEMYAALVRGT
jgi:ATP synthase I chain